MRPRKNQPATSTAIAEPGVRLNAQNYLDAFRVCAATRGRWFVISSGAGLAGARQAATPARWAAWMRWFADHDIPHLGAARFGVATVPTEWPEDFDPSAPPSDRAYRPPATPLASPVDRSRLARELEALAYRLTKLPDKRRPKPDRMPAEAPEDELQRILARYRSSDAPMWTKPVSGPPRPLGA